tara:strand:+ start:59 stop:580 length:522 start_codon:yes stop_codon:yes gene_type:complete
MKTLTLNNFFDNPDDIKNLALSLDYRSRDVDEYFEGVRSPMIKEIDINLYDNTCSKILLEYYGKQPLSYNADLFFHQTKDEDKKDTQWLNDRVHTDKGQIAGIIYLTPNAPTDCGTQTYLKIDGKYVPDIKMGNVYNRLIVYPSNFYHSAINLFGDGIYNRLVILFFLYEVGF